MKLQVESILAALGGAYKLGARGHDRHERRRHLRVGHAGRNPAEVAEFEVQAQQVDWLLLTADGNRAARFDIEDSVLKDANWCIP